MITHLLDAGDFARAASTGEAVVGGEGYRHLFRARRLATGERLRLVDGRGRARWAEVKRVGRRDAVLVLGGEAPANEPAYALQLVVAMLRPERAAWLVEKATELGVVAIRFLRTARTPRELSAARLGRLERVARAALVQCHRARLPEISGVHPWAELERLVHGQGDRFFLDPEADPATRLERRGLSGTVLVGPEGGWDATEQKTLARHAVPIGLGPRILRVETAALVAAARLLP